MKRSAYQTEPEWLQRQISLQLSELYKYNGYQTYLNKIHTSTKQMDSFNSTKTFNLYDEKRLDQQFFPGLLFIPFLSTHTSTN